MIRFLEDVILARLQRRCDHPANMVAADILEGCADGIVVRYCRRCGAVKTDWRPNAAGARFISLDHTWRRPDPHLWRDPVTLWRRAWWYVSRRWRPVL